jgi:glycosyltransferase involved in cell wall biosynthesis
VVAIDFENIPDLYPAIALTCERLKLSFQATGTSRLRFKESNRLRSVRLHEVNNDHRMAMALLCADYPVSIEEQACIAKSYPNFAPQHITPIKGVNDDNLGKKHALSKLIHAATSEYVWLHDDDIVLPPACAKAVVLEGDLLILPLKMESENAAPSLLERLQIAEYAAIQELTMRTAKRNQAIMCSGANLIVRREVWLACEADIHPEIPSGDDMFLLEAAKRRGYQVRVIDTPDYTAIVRPLTSWRAFFRQRMRWAGKAPHYTDKDIRRYGAIIVAANLAQLLFFPIILIKFPIEYGLIKNREPRTPWYVALLIEILYPIYMLVAFFGGLLRTNRW